MILTVATVAEEEMISAKGCSMLFVFCTAHAGYIRPRMSLFVPLTALQTEDSIHRHFCTPILLDASNRPRVDFFGGSEPSTAVVRRPAAERR